MHLNFAGQDDVAQEVSIAPNGSAPVYWTVSVPRTLSVTVRMQALTADGRGDALRLSLPVNAFMDRVSYTRYQSISDTASISVVLPLDVDRNLDELVIEVEPTLIAGIESGLEYLVGFPYGCVEQTMSSFLPDVVVLRLIQETGIDIRPGFHDQLNDMIAAGLQRLYGYQHNDGGWGWWKDDKSNPSIGSVIDRSVGGMRLALFYEVDVGTVLSIKPLRCDDIVPWVELEVRSCRPSVEMPGHFDVGCQYVKSPPYSIQLLFR